MLLRKLSKTNPVLTQIPRKPEQLLLHRTQAIRESAKGKADFSEQAQCTYMFVLRTPHCEEEYNAALGALADCLSQGGVLASTWVTKPEEHAEVQDTS